MERIDVNKRDNLGKTVLFYLNKTECQYKKYISLGCDVNIRDNDNHTALYYAAKQYLIELIKPFIDAGAEYDIDRDFEPEIQLHMATLFGNIPKMKEILDRNKFLVNSRVYRWNGFMKIHPLYIACENGLYEEFLVLLDYGANIHDSHNYLKIVLQNGNHKKAIDIFRHLIKLGLDVKAPVDSNGETLLHRCYKNKVDNIDEFINVIIENGADIHAKTQHKKPERFRYDYTFQFGGEPLHFISSICFEKKTFETFFKYGADPNVPNSFGKTPFMVLVHSSMCLFTQTQNQNDTFEIVKMFIDNGADIYKEDEFGNTALDWICHNRHILPKIRTQIIKYLDSKNMITKIKPQTNQIIYSILESNLTIVRPGFQKFHI